MRETENRKIRWFQLYKGNQRVGMSSGKHYSNIEKN